MHHQQIIYFYIVVLDNFDLLLESSAAESEKLWYSYK